MQSIWNEIRGPFRCMSGGKSSLIVHKAHLMDNQIANRKPWMRFGAENERGALWFDKNAWNLRSATAENRGANGQVFCSIIYERVGRWIRVQPQLVRLRTEACAIKQIKFLCAAELMEIAELSERTNAGRARFLVGPNARARNGRERESERKSEPERERNNQPRVYLFWSQEFIAVPGYISRSHARVHYK